MKYVILFFFLFLAACAKEETEGSTQEVPIEEPGLIQPITIQFQSLGVWDTDGTDDVKKTIDDEEVLTIPSTIELIEDSNSSVKINDTAYLMFVTSKCTYIYDGIEFKFFSCQGDLVGFQDGDQLTLKSIENVSFPSVNGRVLIGLERSHLELHTGFITLETELK